MFFFSMNFSLTGIQDTYQDRIFNICIDLYCKRMCPLTLNIFGVYGLKISALVYDCFYGITCDYKPYVIHSVSKPPRIVLNYVH